MSLVVYNELKNLIIGGDFNVNPWQRGTTFVSPVTTDYIADRFQIRKSGVQDFTITQNTDSPTHTQSGLFDTQCMNINVTTPNAAPGATDFTTIEQPIEGYMAMPIYNNAFSIGFWAWSDVTGTYCVAFQNAARDRSYIGEYTITTPNTWERFEFLVIHDASAGTWEIDENAGVRIIFTLNAGSAFQGAADTWQTGDLVATSNQVNFSATGGNDFRIALVRCTKDSVADSYWMRDRMTQLALCQRYYQKSYNQGTPPATITGIGSILITSPFAVTTLTEIRSDFQTSMRTTPTATWYSSVTGNSGNIANLTTALDVVVSATFVLSDRLVGAPDLAVAPAVANAFSAHFTVEAEI